MILLLCFIHLQARIEGFEALEILAESSDGSSFGHVLTLREDKGGVGLKGGYPPTQAGEYYTSWTTETGGDFIYSYKGYQEGERAWRGEAWPTRLVRRLYLPGPEERHVALVGTPWTGFAVAEFQVERKMPPWVTSPPGGDYQIGPLGNDGKTVVRYRAKPAALELWRAGRRLRSVPVSGKPWLTDAAYSPEARLLANPSAVGKHDSLVLYRLTGRRATEVRIPGPKGLELWRVWLPFGQPKVAILQVKDVQRKRWEVWTCDLSRRLWRKRGDGVVRAVSGSQRLYAISGESAGSPIVQYVFRG